MEFKLIFKGCNSVAKVQSSPIGLLDLDEARKELGVNFSASLMEDNICAYDCCEVRIILTEEQARNTGLFANNSTETVTVVPNSLNKFIKRILSVKRDDNNGAILSVAYKNSLDKEEVFEKWLADGCPIEWNVV